jgi:predicted nucleic acid-binding protein
VIVYIDTSAAMKLIADEPESAELVAYCDAPDVTIASSDLLETELRRAAIRARIPDEAVRDALSRIDLYELSRGAFAQAGRLPGRTLRSLDALHVVSAARLAADAVLSYDTRMSEAAASLGLTVVAPGADGPTRSDG